MLIHPTLERLRALGLSGMADAFVELDNTPDAAELSHQDWFGLLFDREATSRSSAFACWSSTYVQRAVMWS